MFHEVGVRLGHSQDRRQATDTISFMDPDLERHLCCIPLICEQQSVHSIGLGTRGHECLSLTRDVYREP